MTKRRAIVDLLILLLVFWLTWGTQYLDFTQYGPATVLVSAVVIIILLKMRKIAWADIGLVRVKNGGVLIKHTLMVMLLTFVIQAIGITIANLFSTDLTGSSAITTQPDNLFLFLFDIVFTTWLITGLGEEFIFRGFILHHLKTIFPSSRYFIVASLIQAAWFGLGHASQGITGMIITGAIGFFLAQYYLKNKEVGLLPLILSHGVIDTVVLTANYINKL